MMEEYKEGRILEKDEYLLKIGDKKYQRREGDVGFLSKLTQKGEIPKHMINWGNGIISNATDQQPHTKWETYYPKIHIHKEKLAFGWMVVDYRTGKSQDWAIVKHPDGFEVEIYMKNFFEIIKENRIVCGEIEGRYRWDSHKLHEDDFN